MNVAYFGNPLLDEISKSKLKFSLKPVKPIIALLPGSRLQEIKSILPIMLSVIDYFPNYQFVIAANKMISLDIYKKIIDNKNVDLVFGETYGLLNNSKFALVTSGTATLETCFNVPQIICYRTSFLTYLIAKTIIKTKYISLVNILLDRLVVKELIQSQLNTKNLKQELDLIIDDSRRIYQDYNILKKQLNEKGASKKIAEFIYSSI